MEKDKIQTLINNTIIEKSCSALKNHDTLDLMDVYSLGQIDLLNRLSAINNSEVTRIARQLLEEMLNNDYLENIKDIISLVLKELGSSDEV